MDAAKMDAVKEEIEALHDFFVAWFTGRADEHDFEAGFLKRFDPDFHLIPPAGTLLDLNDIASSIRQGHASNPDFRIAIRDVQIRKVFDGHILATYEEWQRNALASTFPDNARLATVLFANTQPLRWVHIHETWMPKHMVTTLEDQVYIVGGSSTFCPGTTMVDTVFTGTISLEGDFGAFQTDDAP